MEQSFAHLGVLLYAVLALVGMVYSAALYARFDVPVLDFYETPDFLLGVAAGPTVLVVGIAAVLVVLALLVWTYSRHLQGFAQGQADEPDRFRRGRYWTWGLAIAAVVSPFAVAAATGATSAEHMASEREDKGDARTCDVARCFSVSDRVAGPKQDNPAGRDEQVSLLLRMQEWSRGERSGHEQSRKGHC